MAVVNPKQDLAWRQGTSFSRVVRWETEPFLFATITGISNDAPVRITTENPHGLTDGWRVAVVGARGLTELNAEFNPPQKQDFRRASVVNANAIEFNALSAAGYGVYEDGGFLQFYTPQDIAGYTARMSIKDRVGGTVLLSLTTENGRIVLDNTAKTITLDIAAADTEAVTWTNGVYDLELVSPDDVVTSLMYGAIKLTKEVTTV